MPSVLLLASLLKFNLCIIRKNDLYFIIHIIFLHHADQLADYPSFFSGTPSNTILLKTGRASIHVPFIISMLRSYFRNSYLTMSHLSQFLVSYYPYVVSLLPVCLYVCVCVGMREHPCVCVCMGVWKPEANVWCHSSIEFYLTFEMWSFKEDKIFWLGKSAGILAIFFPVLGL